MCNVWSMIRSNCPGHRGKRDHRNALSAIDFTSSPWGRTTVWPPPPPRPPAATTTTRTREHNTIKQFLYTERKWLTNTWSPSQQGLQCLVDQVSSFSTFIRDHLGILVPYANFMDRCCIACQTLVPWVYKAWVPKLDSFFLHVYHSREMYGVTSCAAESKRFAHDLHSMIGDGSWIDELNSQAMHNIDTIQYPSAAQHGHPWVSGPFPT